MANQKLKILYIIPRFYPFKGGAEQNFLALSKRMAAAGHDVTVFTTDFKFRDEKLVDYENYEGIKIFRLKSFIKNPYYLCFIPGLLVKLIKNKPDIIHVSGFGFIWIEFCLIVKKLFSPKIIMIDTPHGPFMALGDTKGFRGFSRRTYTKVLKFILPKTYKRVVAVVPKQNIWLKEDYGFSDEKIILVPNGVEQSYIEKEKNIPEFNAEDKVIITYAGRMEWYKGIQDVIIAIAEIKEGQSSVVNKLPEFEFHAMGKPDKFTKTLERMVEENKLEDQVKLIYAPTDTVRDQEYLGSQIFILPSKWEATGIVLMEAMAKGNVIITTNQNQGVEMLIKEGKSGYAYDFGDIEKLKQILVTLLSSFELRQKIIKHNLEFVKNFTWENIFPKYEQEVRSLVQK